MGHKMTAAGAVVLAALAGTTVSASASGDAHQQLHQQGGLIERMGTGAHRAYDDLGTAVRQQVNQH